MDGLLKELAGLEGFWSFLRTALWIFLILFLVGYKFNQPLINLLDRLRAITKDGITLGDVDSQEEEKSPLLSPSHKVLQATGEVDTNYNQLPEELRTFVEQTKQQIHALAQSDTSLVEKYYLLALGNLSLSFLVRDTYRLIFASQTRLLEEANVNGGVITSEAATNIFIEAKAAFPDFHQTRTFDDWQGFLIARGLMKHLENELHLTSLGKRYLIQLPAEGLPRKNFG